jgi:hypothetical protein
VGDGGFVIATALVVAVAFAVSCSSSTGKGFDSAPLDSSFDADGMDVSVSRGPGADAPFLFADECDLACETAHPTIALRVVDAQGDSVPAPTFSTAGQPLKPSPFCGEAVDVDGASFDVTFLGSTDGGAQGDAGDGGLSNCDVWVFIASGYSLSEVWQVLVSAPGYASQTVAVMLRGPTGCTCAGLYGSQTVTLSPNAGLDGALDAVSSD